MLKLFVEIVPVPGIARSHNFALADGMLGPASRSHTHQRRLQHARLGRPAAQCLDWPSVPPHDLPRRQALEHGTSRQHLASVAHCQVVDWMGRHPGGFQ